jgi:prepilin-type N-terminal cleavage/methylation domain-containing protein
MRNAKQNRGGFTLIELVVVVVIIAIIAAIAIPNLLESRVTSQESASAAALKSGLLPAEVQFQNGGYSDADSNGIGCYAVVGGSLIAVSGAQPYDTLSGQATINGITLNLMSPSYSGVLPTISGYNFKQPATESRPTTTLDYGGERVWATICYPADDNQGRRFFAINQAGNVYASKPSPKSSSSATPDVGGSVSTVSSTNLFGLSLVGSPVTTFYLPYRK